MSAGQWNIAYGVLIGSGDNGWKFSEYDEDELEMSWPAWVALDADGWADDVIEQFETRLTEKLGEDCGLEFDMAGHDTYAAWVLCATNYRASGYSDLGNDEEEIAILLASLTPEIRAELDTKFEAAFAALELTITNRTRLIGYAYSG